MGRVGSAVARHVLRLYLSAAAQSFDSLGTIMKLLPILVGLSLVATFLVVVREPSQKTFTGSRAGRERRIQGIKFCWCPAGRFTMGSPPGEMERRPDEFQVEVTLTRGFWMA